jgi:hypothetical protein
MCTTGFIRLVEYIEVFDATDVLIQLQYHCFGMQNSRGGYLKSIFSVIIEFGET